jgi:pimeloyl-ACP methyl ester carboxylesterase
VPVPTLVLLHGQPDSSASFWSLRRELRVRLDPGIRIVAPDRPGYGANPLPGTDYRGNVDWLGRWLGAIDAGPTVLVGHSWAGGIGILGAAGRAAANAPGDVPGDIPSGLASMAGLALVASIGPYCLLPIDSLLGAPLLGNIIAFGMLQLAGPLLRRSASSTIGTHLADRDLPYAKASGFAMAYRPLWRTFLDEQRALIRELDGISAALPAIDVPTLVVDGTQDKMIPSRTPSELTRRIPGARRVRLTGAHDLQLRQPVELAEHVASFATPLFAGVAGAEPLPAGEVGNVGR